MPWVNEEEEIVRIRKLEKDNDKDNFMKKMNCEFSIQELDRPIANCKDKSSSGVDGIEYKMIKGLDKEFRMILLELINFSFRTTGRSSI